MTINFTEIPPRMNEIWEWVVAFDAYDYGDGAALAALILRGDPIPHEALPQLSKIVLGQRQPKLKAAAKLKVPAGERMIIAASISTIVGLTETIRIRAIEMGPDGWEPALPRVADRKGTETIDQVRYLERKARDYVRDAAERLNVSVETVENLLRDLRRKIAAFPEI